MQEALRYLSNRIHDRKRRQLSLPILRKIAQLAHPDATDFLIEKLRTRTYYPSDQIRLLTAIAEADDPRAKDIIWEHTKASYPPIPIIQLYGDLQEERAIPILIRTLKSKDLLAGERITAAIALGNIGKERAVPELIKVLGEDVTFIGFEEVPYPKHLPLAAHALMALRNFETPAAREAVAVWERRHHERAQARVSQLTRIATSPHYNNWRHDRDILRLGHYAFDFVKQIPRANAKAFKRAISGVCHQLTLHIELLPRAAHTKIVDHIIYYYEALHFSIYDQSYKTLLIHLDDPRIDPQIVEWLEKYYAGWRKLDALKVAGARKIHAAIPVILEMYNGTRLYSENKTHLLRALMGIGTEEAQYHVERLLNESHFSLKKDVMESYAQMHQGTDVAYDLLDEVIASSENDPVTKQYAIRLLSYGGEDSFAVLMSYLAPECGGRTAALYAIMDRPNAKAVPHIFANAIYDKPEPIARIALERIGTEEAYTVLNALDQR